MKNKKAIVTLVIGEERYLANWKKYCEPNWRPYADKFGFDLICLNNPLDDSERARKRSPSWQKCLILGQAFAHYQTIVWIDSDIIFNDRAPDITEGVPLEKVGAVEDPLFQYASIERWTRYWPNGVINYTPRDYYVQFGLPSDCNQTINAGVLVLSPLHHREILEHVYHAYEDKGGPKWHMEQRPLSYELVKAGLIHWLDPRFNVLVAVEEMIHYPFLHEPPASHTRKTIIDRIMRKIGKMYSPSNRALLRFRADAVNALYQSSYFLHFGGKMEEMPLVRRSASLWWDILQWDEHWRS
jgi:hypothetical protein